MSFSATAHAIASPSRFDVPLPSSSINTCRSPRAQIYKGSEVGDAHSVKLVENGCEFKGRTHS